jgi:two-component system copper resistance phosphate regulon response regulator CusR
MRILVVEDQTLIGKAIQRGLVEEAFAVDWATTMTDGLHLALEFDYDAIILDLMLPDGSGFELLTELRKKNFQTPVLILSARDSLEDKSRAFNLGTDDYLVKPFAFEELLGRIRALTRRKYGYLKQQIEIGGLTLDFTARTAQAGEIVLNLTSKEFALLELVVLRRTHILSREKIIEHLYSENADQESNVIDVFINKLRRKLEAAGIGSLIETVRGEGYVVR